MKSQQRKEGKVATAKVLPIKKTTEEPEVDLARKTVVLVLRFGTVGNSRAIPTSRVDVGDTDPAMVKVTKQLLKSKELKAIWKADASLKRAVGMHCLPFDVAIRLVPLKKVPTVNAMCKEYEEQIRPPLVKAFLKAYPSLCERAAKLLGNNYNPADYPPVKAVAKEFYYRYQFVSFGTPGQLEDISAEIFEQEKEKGAEVMREAAEVIQDMRRAEFAGLVEHLAKKLEDDEKRDGKPKIFRDTTVKKMTAFLNEFDVMNANNDVELKAMVEKAKAIMKGVSVEALRTVDTTRDKVRESLKAVAEKLDTMIVDRPGRKFRDLSDEA